MILPNGTVVRYEYKTFYEEDTTKLDKRLNDLDALGWDVVSVSQSFLGHYCHMTIACRKPVNDRSRSEHLTGVLR